MLELIATFFLGAFIFLITGTDDFSVVYLLLNKHKTRKNFISVALGTMIGVCLMFCSSAIIAFLVKSQLEKMYFLKFFGFVPIALGIYFLFKCFEKDEESETTEISDNKVNLVLKSMIIYVTNMSDDVFFNSSYLFMLYKNQSHIFLTGSLFLGNLAGCLLMIFLAKILAKITSKSKYKRAAPAIAAIVLIAIGVNIIFSE